MPTLETMKTPPNAGTPCLKGAGNYDDPDCPGTDCYRAWQETSGALFREFLNQNPHLATARPLRTMHCLEQLTTGSRGRHKGIAGVCQDPLRSERVRPLDCRPDRGPAGPGPVAPVRRPGVH